MIEKILEKEANELRKIIKEVDKRKKDGPEGILRISEKKTGTEYYIKNKDCEKVAIDKDLKLQEGKTETEEIELKISNGRYLKKQEMQIAKEIAQRDYDIKLLKIARARLHAIEVFQKKYKENSIKDIFKKMHPSRRKLIDKIIISDEEYVKRWSEVAYIGKEHQDYENVIITEKGERVRSKSEKIIADKLNMLGIPYRYEYPIFLEGNIKIYPDFTILKMPERKEVYLEHFGMLDDVDYMNTTLLKLNTYEKNGIFLGMKLFFTYETSKKTLNTKALDRMLKELFCKTT